MDEDFERRLLLLEDEVALLRAATARRSRERTSFRSITPIDRADVDELRQSLHHAAQLVEAHEEGKATDAERCAVVLATHLRRTVRAGYRAFKDAELDQDERFQPVYEWFEQLLVLGGWHD